MAQGRIKRLQSAAQSQFQQLKTAELAVCALCDRPIPPALRDAHHLIPKSRGGVVTVFMHRACHKQIHALFTETELARHYPSEQIHALFTETELARHYPSAQALRAQAEVAKFIHWVQDKPSDFNPPTRRSRRKGQKH